MCRCAGVAIISSQSSGGSEVSLPLYLCVQLDAFVCTNSDRLSVFPYYVSAVLYVSMCVCVCVNTKFKTYGKSLMIR